MQVSIQGVQAYGSREEWIAKLMAATPVAPSTTDAATVAAAAATTTTPPAAASGC